ncbi:MAG: S9 family peptidase, partial [Gemmatimonadetes bacterium]|nr:S9 family peptidase [Gemmatimonadota bacterium]
MFGAVVMLAATACMHPVSTGDLGLPPTDAGYLWLEELRSDTVLRWADAHTTRAREHLTSRAVHDSLVAELRAATESSRFVPHSGVPAPAIRTGAWANRFAGGIWMRQPVERFERGDNAWERVLDLDSLSRAEHARFDIASVECLPPSRERCLVLLSSGGASRTFEVREYDAAARMFVTDGFNLEPGYTSIFWRDSTSVYITSSPMSGSDDVRIWRRGQRLEDAQILFVADPRDSPSRGDQGVAIARHGEELLLAHSRHQYDIEYFLVQDDEAVRL